MSTLTAEELGKQLEKQRKAIAADVTEQIGTLKVQLETRMDDRFDDLGRMIATGFHDLEGRLDVREQVKKHDHRIGRVEHALNIKA